MLAAVWSLYPWYLFSMKSGRKNRIVNSTKLSSRHAIDELLEAGISVVYLKDGKLVRKGPDNTLTVVKELENKEKFDLREFLTK